MGIPTKILSSILFMVLSTSSSATIYSVHCPLGCPGNLNGNDLVFNHVYALSNSGQTKFATWVAYEVDVTNFGVSPGREWTSDPLLHPSKTLEEEDYKGVNSSPLQADRGHQAPLATFAGSKYWYELNYLSNITPQDRDLNQGPWKALEDAERAAVRFRKNLFVITGPLFLKEMIKMPHADEPHLVPSAYFKVIYNLEGNAAFFIMDQSVNRTDKYCEKVVSLETLNTHLNFPLPTLRESKELISQLGCM
jgi:endonuclease G, mitochondrial